jgi:LuxR family maltose regulon positive regulatory protein
MEPPWKSAAPARADALAPDPCAVTFSTEVASVARENPGFGEKSFSHQDQSASLNVSTLVDSFICDLEKLADPILLVVDDLHLVYDADWVIPFFQRLLGLLPAEVHALILGRGLPPAPLWRLRSKQRLCLINESMLAFSQSEAEALYARYGLDAQRANESLIKTGGRAAAIHTAALQAEDRYLVDFARPWISS